MGYSARWRSWWRTLKQCICIWQFFIILLSWTGYAVCSPCILSCLWVILTGRYRGAALCGSSLWKPNANRINHLRWHSHILYFHWIPGFYWPQGRAVHPSVRGEQSAYPCSGYTGKKDMAASSCLALSHLRAAAARELAWVGAWAGQKATGTTESPIWSLPHYRLWFCLPITRLPRQQIEHGHSCPEVFWQLILLHFQKHKMFVCYI